MYIVLGGKIMLHCVLGNCGLLAVMFGALALYLRDRKDCQ